MSGESLTDGFDSTGKPTPTDEDQFDFVETPRQRSPLKLDTKLAMPPQLQAVSMVPTPVSSASPKEIFAQDRPRTQAPSPRILSASLVPDPLSILHASRHSGATSQPDRLHRNLLPSSEASEKRIEEAEETPDTLAETVRRGNSLFIAKRGEKLTAQLNRSASVGGPQRQPSTVLHREPKASVFHESELPEEVYIASDISGAKTAWKRVKFVGKGSFSEVVLSRPAIEFIKPEYRDEVETIVERELDHLENPNSQAHRGDSSASNVGPKLLVAVKITALNRAKGQSQLEYFRRDVEIMSSIPHHPSLMRILGSSLDQEYHRRALFILPYCCGGDLFDLVAKNRSKLSSNLIRRVFADVCAAVVFLHKNLIVHRDIKLENVLLDISVTSLLEMKHPEQFNYPIAVLTDLGLARRIDPKHPTLTTRCGSDDYVPPEIMLGQPYDGRETDSWALGVLLYAMLEGRLPFDAPPHSAQHEGSRARLKTAHRIARVDWNWYKRKDEDREEWIGGKEIVDLCLKRRATRAHVTDINQRPWVADARPAEVVDSFGAESICNIFVQ